VDGRREDIPAIAIAPGNRPAGAYAVARQTRAPRAGLVPPRAEQGRCGLDKSRSTYERVGDLRGDGSREPCTLAPTRIARSWPPATGPRSIASGLWHASRRPVMLSQPVSRRVNPLRPPRRARSMHCAARRRSAASRMGNGRGTIRRTAALVEMALRKATPTRIILHAAHRSVLVIQNGFYRWRASRFQCGCKHSKIATVRFQKIHNSLVPLGKRQIDGLC